MSQDYTKSSVWIHYMILTAAVFATVIYSMTFFHEKFYIGYAILFAVIVIVDLILHNVLGLD